MQERNTYVGALKSLPVKANCFDICIFSLQSTRALISRQCNISISWILTNTRRVTYFFSARLFYPLSGLRISDIVYGRSKRPAFSVQLFTTRAHFLQHCNNNNKPSRYAREKLSGSRFNFRALFPSSQRRKRRYYADVNDRGCATFRSSR